MRLLLLILMIALLPLRGWVGDAMATEMVTAQVQQQQTAAKTPAAHAHEAGVLAHHDTEAVMADVAQQAADCAGHAFAGDDHADDTHCSTCSVCQACHTVALSPVAAHMATAFNPRTLPHAVVAQFASAEAALSEKPPIS
jgi:hypothetical protein